MSQIQGADWFEVLSHYSPKYHFDPELNLLTLTFTVEGADKLVTDLKNFRRMDMALKALKDVMNYAEEAPLKPLHISDNKVVPIPPVNIFKGKTVEIKYEDVSEWRDLESYKQKVGTFRVSNSKLGRRIDFEPVNDHGSDTEPIWYLTMALRDLEVDQVTYKFHSSQSSRLMVLTPRGFNISGILAEVAQAYRKLKEDF